MKAKSTLLAALFVSGALVAAPSQAHHDDFLWPLLPLTGLILLHNHHHDHGHHRYHHDDDHYRHHRRRHSHSYGDYDRGRSRHRDRDHRGDHRRYRD